MYRLLALAVTLFSGSVVVQIEPMIAVSAANVGVNVNDAQTFTPDSVTISVGDTVTWTWTGDQPHSVTGTGFDSEIQTGAGTTFPYQFNTPGTFNYICVVHAPNMSGTIIVREPPTATNTTAPTNTSIAGSVTPEPTDEAGATNTPRATSTGSPLATSTPVAGVTAIADVVDARPTSASGAAAPASGLPRTGGGAGGRGAHEAVVALAAAGVLALTGAGMAWRRRRV